MTEPNPNRWGVLFAVCVTQFAAPFMLSSVGVVLPAIGMDLNANGVALSLVESVFLGINAMSLLCFGRASDLMGRNWIFTTGLGLFVLSTIMLGFAPTIHAMIAIRALQGLGGAMQVSTGLAILLDVYPPEERGRVLGISLACIYLGLSAGPFAGGFIAHALGWRWLFFVGCLPCVLALFLAFKGLKWDYRPAEAPFDLWGMLVSTVCVGLLLYGGANVDTRPGLAALGAFALCLALFLRHEARCEHPLLDLKLFAGNVDFSTGNMLQFINYSATFGLTFLMSLFLQLGYGMTPLEAGSILVAQPLTQSVLSPLCGRLADRRTPEMLVTAGTLLCVAGLAWGSTFDAATSLVAVACMLGTMGVGVALFVSPNMKMIMSAVASRQYGVATAVTGQMRILGMTMSMVGISVAISFIVGDRVLDHTAFADFNRAMHVVLTCAAILGAVGTAISLIAPRWGKRRMKETS